nr:hypothetical protein [Angustibacter aerolatus]
MRHQPGQHEARATAAQALDASLSALRAAGVEAEGEVTGDDPLPALRAHVERLGAREVVVVTRPHAVEDTFHRDWASRARDEPRRARAARLRGHDLPGLSARLGPPWSPGTCSAPSW